MLREAPVQSQGGDRAANMHVPSVVFVSAGSERGRHTGGPPLSFPTAVVTVADPDCVSAASAKPDLLLIATTEE